MNMSIPIDKESCRKLLKVAGARKVAFVYHLKIRDSNGYNKWLIESNKSFKGKRLFRVQADPVPREGMLINEIVIDEFPSTQVAFDIIAAFEDTLKQVCSEYTALAIVPELSHTFHLVKGISVLVQLFKGVKAHILFMVESPFVSLAVARIVCWQIAGIILYLFVIRNVETF
jgi:hypothetical protein